MNIKDIAKMANVGVGTVSRVLNNHPNVKESTRKKVLDVINEINYIPNNSARNLKQTKTNSNSIGVLVRGVFNPFFSEMIDIINRKITEAGYSMVLRQNDFAVSGDDEVRKLVELGREIRLQGLIYIGCALEEINEDTFRGINVPLVLISPSKSYEKLEEHNFSSIGINQEKAAAKATEYLIEKKAKNIGIVLGARDKSIIDIERLKGFKDILYKNKIKFNEKALVYGEYDTEVAYKETKRLLKANKKLDGIFCTSDIMAIGCAKALVEKGYKIGEDIILIGFDGMNVVKFYNPSIPTIVQPRAEMATIGVDTLIDLIKCRDGHKMVELETRVFE